MTTRTFSIAGLTVLSVFLLGFQLHRFFAVEDDAAIVRDFYVDEDTLVFERHSTADIPPLKGKGGRDTVVIARCFFDSDDKLVIGWLARYPAETKKQLEDAWKSGALSADLAMSSVFQQEVRRPEEGSPWVPLSNKDSAAICIPPAHATKPAFPK